MSPLRDGRPSAASSVPPPRLGCRLALLIVVPSALIGLLINTGQLHDAAVEGAYERLGWFLLVGTLQAALVAGLIVVVARRLIADPLASLTRQAQRLAAGDLAQPLRLPDTRLGDRRDEIHRLADAFETLRTSQAARNDALRIALHEKESALAALGDSQTHLLRAQQMARLGSWSWDTAQPDAMRWSEQLREMLGASPDEQPSMRRLWEAIPRGDAAIVSRQMEVALRFGEASSVELLLADGDGNPRLLRHGVEPVGAGKLVGTAQDITELKRTEAELELAASVFAHAHEGIIVVDAENKILTVNPAFTRITGYSAEEAIGQTPRLLRSEHQNSEFYREMWQQILSTGEWQGELWNRRKNGEAYLQWSSITTMTDFAGRVSRRIAVVNDITEMHLKDERLHHQAYHDALTGLPNRLLLQDRLATHIAQAHSDGEMLAVLFVDLDRFKFINDSLGHQAGDMLLRLVTPRLAACVTERDTIGRQGGDEFVILLPHLAHIQDATHVASKAIEALSTGFELDHEVAHVGASVGISIFPQDGADADTLLKNADAAMHAAKADSRGGFRFFDAGMNGRALQRLQLEAGLRRALERREFELYYQAKVDLRDGTYGGAEALIRWNEPERGLVSPADFIPVAEDTGLIGVIGDWAVDEACRQARLWRANGSLSGPLAVNVSARQLDDRGFVDRVRHCLQRHELEARWLQIEVTESAVMNSPELAIAVLQELKSLGLSIAIDDFGTGHSSFAYLQRLPVDVLKIDRSFVKEIGTGPRADSIVHAIINVATALGIELVAEGVETPAQAAFLAAAGCRYAQGFWFARPLPAAETLPLNKTPPRDWRTALA
jgi:diguanylate cyclase (GGDEF)-like protein/PAS domain S-box-containing protein